MARRIPRGITPPIQIHTDNGTARKSAYFPRVRARVGALRHGAIIIYTRGRHSLRLMVALYLGVAKPNARLPKCHQLEATHRRLDMEIHVCGCTGIFLCPVVHVCTAQCSRESLCVCS